MCDTTDLATDAAWAGYAAAKNIIVETANLVGSSDVAGEESQLEITICGWDLSVLSDDLAGE